MKKTCYQKVYENIDTFIIYLYTIKSDTISEKNKIFIKKTKPYHFVLCLWELVITDEFLQQIDGDLVYFYIEDVQLWMIRKVIGQYAKEVSEIKSYD